MLEVIPTGVSLRVVFRISEPGDLLNFTSARALQLLRELPGTDVRYSPALHAKAILVDGKSGLISHPWTFRSEGG